MSRLRQTALMAFFVVAFAAGTFVYFRVAYCHSKRLRVIVPDRFYRCGQLTEAGFTEAVEKFRIRTVLNVQDDIPDPDVWRSWFNRSTIKESALCRQLGVNYVWLSPDLHSRRKWDENPKVVNEFINLMYDEANYPVLIHCKAGLHRTGLLTAVYRMQYQGWSPAAALRELKAHGFGDWAATSANDYVSQYVLHYKVENIRQTGFRREAQLAP